MVTVMPNISTLVKRGTLLFSLGVLFYWMCDVLQSVRGGLLDPDSELLNGIPQKLLIPLSCGAASGLLIFSRSISFTVIVGLLSPFVDFRLGLMEVYNKEWSSVFRCVAMFYGINHATTRMDFTSFPQLVLTIIGLSIAHWWFFDGSYVGLAFGTVVAVMATVIGQSFIWKHLFQFSHPGMFAWIPGLFFSGGITSVLVGRQLAKNDVLEHGKIKDD